MFMMHITEILFSNREISFKIMTLYIKKKKSNARYIFKNILNDSSDSSKKIFSIFPLLDFPKLKQ